MWIVKGFLLGIWLVSFGTIAYLYLAVFRRLPPGGAVGVSVFTSLIVDNPYWWLSMVACFAIGILVTRSWPGKPILWITLIVTELFPVALLVLFFTLVSRNKEMIERMSK